MAAARSAKWVLVIGQCGDGKTTLVNALRAAHVPEIVIRKVARGDTKSIQVYEGRPLPDGTPLFILDTPGVGDGDVTVMKLVAMIEAALESHQRREGGIDGVVVTQQVCCPRVQLGAQVVLALVQKGVVGGPEKWKNVILCGTKADLADDETRTFFASEIAPIFFGDAGGVGPNVLVTAVQGDVEPLRQAIAALPNLKVQYRAPPPGEMAAHFAGMLGATPEQVQAMTAQFSEQLSACRDAFRMQGEQITRLMEMLAAGERQHREQTQAMAEQLHRTQEEALRAQRERAQAERARDEAWTRELQEQHQASMQLMQQCQQDLQRMSTEHNRQMMQVNANIAQAVAAAGSRGDDDGWGCSIM